VKHALFLIPLAALAAGVTVAPKHSYAASHVQLAQARAQANDYMADPSANDSDDDVPVVGLPPDDSGTESNATTVTDVPNEYVKQHASELEDDADSDEDVDGNDSLDRDGSDDPGMDGSDDGDDGDSDE